MVLTSSRGTHLAALVLLASLVGATGCRTMHARQPTPGVYQPLFDPGQIRENLADSRREAEEADGVARHLAMASVDLWRALDELNRQLPLPEELGRAREAAALAEYLHRVGRAVRSGPPLQPVEVRAPPVVLRMTDFTETATAAAGAGRYDEAIAAAEVLLDEARGTGEDGDLIDELRFRVGVWHMAAGRLAEARRAFGDVEAAQARTEEMAEGARLMIEEIDLLLTLPDGPIRGWLAEGWALLEAGADREAERVALQVLGAAEPASAREAEFLLSAVRREREKRWNRIEVEGQRDVSDGPPFDQARMCAASLEELGAGERARVLLAAVGTAEAALATTAAAEAERAWAEAAMQSRDLIAGEHFREAAAVFDRFAGTDLEDRARAEAARSLDIHVREQRKQAGELFVAAQRSTDSDERRALLEAARRMLTELETEFPNSAYSERVRRNLQAVEQALGDLAPESESESGSESGSESETDSGFATTP